MSQAAYQKTINISSDGGSTYNEVNANSASLDLAGDLLDETKFKNNNEYRQRIYGLRDWTLNLTCLVEDDTALQNLKKAWFNNSEINIQYFPDGSNGLAGPGLVESFNPSGDVGDMDTVEITIQGNGQLTSAP